MVRSRRLGPLARDPRANGDHARHAGERASHAFKKQIRYLDHAPANTPRDALTGATSQKRRAAEVYGTPLSRRLE